MKSAITLLNDVHAYGLEVFPGFHGLSLVQHEAAWNGVGSEKWSRVFRGATTAFFWRWQGPAFEHDNAWTHDNDGTREGWLASNARFHRNGLRVIRKDVAWWRLLTRRRLYGWQAFLDAMLDTDASWKGWLAAYEAKQSEGPEVSA